MSLHNLTTSLGRVRIVLVETSHAGNIGSVARAMKTMGLSQLVLVNPKSFPDGLAIAMASGAADVLTKARVVSCLSEALIGCRLVIGASARIRASAWPQVDARSAAELLLDSGAGVDVALVFGRENSGLTNSELDQCHYLGHVPTNPEYGVLNIAMAVQVFSYELWMQAQQRQGWQADHRKSKSLATVEELDGFYHHLRQTLLDIDYLDARQHDHFMRRIKRFFVRSRIETKELAIFRGMLRSMQRLARLAKQSGGVV